MRQQNLFREIQARDRGMSVAAARNADLVERLRAVARHLALASHDRTVDINDVREHCEAVSLDVTWGNWAGSIFKHPCFVPCGYTKATHKGAHARVVRRWRLL